MNFHILLKAAGLFFLTCGTAVSASPVEGVSEQLEQVESHAIRNLHGLQNEAGYINGTIEVVAQVVSELVAVQIVGAATSQDQLRFLCNSFDTSRLQNQFYNVTLMREIVCAGSKPADLTPLPLIRNLTTEVSTEIWILQAIGAVQGNVQKLCDILDPVAASKIGLLGDLVKKDVCAAAAVASQVAKSGGTTAVTLTNPQVTSIAPLSELTLSFARVTPTSSSSSSSTTKAGPIPQKTGPK